jgi:CubicO group peptidase (beta-lactamase class C family)
MQRVWRSCPLVIERTAPTGRLRLHPAGYGAGLTVVEDEAIGRMVAHSGGLPGFGSNMRWVPERQIGVVALGNLRYAEMAAMTRSALEALADEGHLDRIAPRRERSVPATLRDAVDRLVALLNDWDDERARSLFADNVELDDGLDRRAAAAAAVRARCGVLAVRSVRASRDTSATVELTGQQADAKLTVQLAPITPARVQSYTLAPIARS